MHILAKDISDSCSSTIYRILVRTLEVDRSWGIGPQLQTKEAAAEGVELLATRVHF